MECARVDHRGDVVALADARPGAEPADDDCLVLADADLRPLGAFGAGVAGELAGLVGLGVRALDREMGHDLRAERLAQLEASFQRPFWRRIRLERRILEVLRTDAE